MGEARRRKEAGDKAYEAPKHARDLEGRRMARAIDEARCRAARDNLPLPLPDRNGRKEGEGFRKDPVIPLLSKKEKKREFKPINRAMRRQMRGARSS